MTQRLVYRSYGGENPTTMFPPPFSQLLYHGASSSAPP